jgi:hypothetical protein
MNDVVTAPKAHQFQPGKSGNPAGRPKGSRNAISIIKLQIEGELRAQMRPQMQAIVAEMLRQALPTDKVDPKTGEITTIPGDRDMLKTLFNSWVSKTKAGDEEAPKEKIVIQIGKLDQIPTVSGRTITNGEE